MVITRFAPSPTGLLHLGNARTAIFSYLFARHHGGKFILRIEDTDVERSKKEFEKALLEDLEWLGIEWDEFHRQSERFEIYKKFVDKLLTSGHAYPCFCTPEELYRERERAKEKGVPYRYSGKCRNLSEDDIKTLKARGLPFTIRFRVHSDEVVTFKDIVKGFISIKAGDFGDFIIVRSDGTPTYNFVVVVDDAMMGITHVIRGEDHLPNTPKQILIYRALGFEMPEFAHLPVILGSDRSKLSKRHGAVSVRHYREEGFIPEALFNYLSLLGWAPSDTEKEIFIKEELVKTFRLEDVNSSPAIFNADKLRWMSGVYIREVISSDRLYELALPFLKNAGFKPLGRDYVLKVLEVTRDSFETLKEMVERVKPFFVRPSKFNDETVRLLKEMEAASILKACIEYLKAEKINSIGDVHRMAKNIKTKLGVKPKNVWVCLRIALTGKRDGVGVDILMSILPQNEVIARLEGAVSLLSRH